jgi:hypothetical protein
MPLGLVSGTLPLSGRDRCIFWLEDEWTTTLRPAGLRVPAAALGSSLMNSRFISCATVGQQTGPHDMPFLLPWLYFY